MGCVALLQKLDANDVTAALWAPDAAKTPQLADAMHSPVTAVGAAAPVATRALGVFIR